MPDIGILTIVVVLVLAVAFASIGGSKVAAVPSMRERAHHLGYSTTSYRLIGLAEFAAAVALVIGLWLPALAVAAAAGLTVLLIGAVVAHLRHGDPLRAAAPAAILGIFAVVTVVCAISELG